MGWGGMIPIGVNVLIADKRAVAFVFSHSEAMYEQPFPEKASLGWRRSVRWSRSRNML